MYLTYAESVLRGGSGDRTVALKYVNDIRKRASATDIADKDFTVDFMLDERAREMHWEATRRTDLIRFGKFTSAAYVWPWKGNTKDGKGVEPHLSLYPISYDDLTANSNLVQNPGYPK